MARGFESKDVEFQQAEAERPQERGPGLTAQEREVDDRRRTIRLALSNVRADLASATNRVHQDMLRQAIAALELQLGALE